MEASLVKFTGSKIKKSRSLGVALTPKAEKYMDRKPYGPGMHGRNSQMRRKKMSPYKAQLVEKQRLRFQYNVHERQMVNYYKKASKKGDLINTLIQLLEARLDAVVLRGGLARTIYAARQYVNHGHVLVNGKKVDIPSYQVKPEDVVSVRKKSMNMDCFHVALDTSLTPPPYITRDKKAMTVTFGYNPPREEIPVTCEIPLVIEYYSR
ncbi:30S ribosomal protein S4 [bacterium]|jgi:small subunit ribosomal protein S4|nr:30S ribosomal protein S4 [bacterium]MBT7311004.1 30S ribosomal protein S4 [bacterium]